MQQVLKIYRYEVTQEQLYCRGKCPRTKNSCVNGRAKAGPVNNVKSKATTDTHHLSKTHLCCSIPLGLHTFMFSFYFQLSFSSLLRYIIVSTVHYTSNHISC